MANNGQEVLEVLSEEICDIVLIYYQFPVIDDYEAIWKIQKWDNTISNIVLTGDALSGHRKFIYTRINDYALKPFKVRELLFLVDKWIS